MIWAGIDPGMRSGLALVSGSGRIAFAETFAAADLEREVCALTVLSGLACVAIELAQAYPGSPVPPQVIVRLAGRARAMAGALEASGVRVRLVTPRIWKGTLDKRRHHESLRRKILREDIDTWDRISEHARDAIGLAIWAREQAT